MLHSVCINAGGRTPVHWAVLGGHVQVLEYLLAKGAWAEGYDSHDDTPLHLAARCWLLFIFPLGRFSRSSLLHTDKTSRHGMHASDAPGADMNLYCMTLLVLRQDKLQNVSACYINTNLVLIEHHDALLACKSKQGRQLIM